MIKNNRYEQIFIKSSANLPPEGKYLVRKKSGEVYYEYEFTDTEICRDKWLVTVEWYMILRKDKNN